VNDSRRTVWDDPFKPGRNGLVGLAQRIEVNSPLALVILMLGTNDFQSVHPQNDPSSASRGIEALVNEIRKAPLEPGMAVPSILIVCPPPIRNPRGTMEAKFRVADQRCSGLALAYRQVASTLSCYFFDAGEVIRVSETDVIHLDKDQHRKFGELMVDVVKPILK
jgi:lysophospholipase L1-like esterase